MKSPWKFFVGFASLGRSAKDSEDPEDVGASEAGATSQATSAPALVSEGNNSDGGSAGAETPDAPADSGNLDTIQPSVAIEALATSEEAAKYPIDEPSVGVAIALKRTTSRRSTSTKAPRRNRKTNNTKLAEAVAVEYGEENSSMQPPLTFGDEVAALEEDVKQLRRRLAEKLRVQNTQLKKLLERYDAS